MPNKTYTDEEIIKALECHIKAEDCEGCEMFGGCEEIILTERVLDLINRQRAEIERLNSANGKKFRQWDMLAEKTKQHYANLYEEAKDSLKAESYKEFAKRIIECCNFNNDLSADAYLSITTDINCVLKEMIGKGK